MNLVKWKSNEASTNSGNARSSPGTKGLIPKQNKMEQLGKKKQSKAQLEKENVQEWLSITSPAQSWADEVENEARYYRDGIGRKITAPKTSIWDKFDINKLNNAGCKLDYVKPIRT